VAADADDEKTTTLPVASLSPFISQKSQNVGCYQRSLLVVLISEKKKVKHEKTTKIPAARRGVRVQQFTNRF
jgi:hypothetical protein